MPLTAQDKPPKSEPEQIARVAIAGNPNSGKTSLFNALTGGRQHVGNYPGVTVEQRTGRYERDGTPVELHDLPGTYSLTSYSPEERIAQRELLDGEHDVVLVVADSTCLQRGLVLLAQVMQLGANPVLCLNMADEARAAGQKLDLEQMRQLLGIPVVETVAHRGEGVAEVAAAIEEARAEPVRRHRLVLGELLASAVAAIGAELDGSRYPAATRDWVASRLLIDDPAFTATLQPVQRAPAAAIRVAAEQRQRIERETGLDIALFVTERYFGFVDGLLREVTVRSPRADARVVSDRIDSVLVHRLFGLPIFGAVMYAIFWLTFSAGELPMGWIEAGFAALGEQITSLWAAGSSSPLRSLLVDGIIGGVGGVVVFVPNIILLFLGLAILEDTGYMARVAFLMDRVMHRFGLHGKSFVPMLTGFGCSIPGIMATRTLENERDRLTTMLVLPLMSCGARLPIWMLIIPAFFAPPWRAPMLWFIYVTGVGLAFVLALLLRRTVLRGEEAPFVMELPPYRLPTLRAVLLKMAERAWIYMRKAGTVILGISILMWAISSYPARDLQPVDEQIAAGELTVVQTVAADGPGADAQNSISKEELEHRRGAEALEYSIAGRIGGVIEPLVRPLGFDRRLATAMLGAFAAKEVFVAQLGIVYSLGETDEGSAGLRAALARDYSPLIGLSLMLFLLIATPCMATIAVTRRESGSWKWAMLQLGGLTAVAYLVSFTVYQIGSLFLGA